MRIMPNFSPKFGIVIYGASMGIRFLVRSGFFLSLFLLASCGTLQLDEQGEPAVKDDAPPPAGYAPVYLKSISPIEAAQPAKPVFSITRLSATQPNAIRAYIHLLDSNGTYYSGALANRFKPWWCGITDEFDGKSHAIKDYKLREVTENDRLPHAIALVMDHSGSMGEPRAKAVQNAAELFLSRKKDEDAIALIKYDNHIGVEAPLLTDVEQLRTRLQKNGLQGYGYTTAVLNGIMAGIDQVRTADKTQQRAVVVFTDGVDNSSTVSKDSIIAEARRTNTIVCAIDFGYGIQDGFLEEIAKATGGTYHRMYSTNEFANVFDDIYRRLHNYYLLEFSPREYGVHTLRLKLCLPNDSLTTTMVYDNTPDIGTTALLDVNFDTGKATIRRTDLSAIDNVYALMKAYTKLAIEVHGHTDNTNRTGDSTFNMVLSQQRADAVKEYLVNKGIAANRIVARGFGDTHPIADNSTEKGKALNRRTEFVIVSK